MFNNIYNLLKDFTNPETINLEIWSANNKPSAMAPAISVTSNIVLIAVLKFNKTKFFVASYAKPPGTNGMIPVTIKMMAGSFCFRAI